MKGKCPAITIQSTTTSARNCVQKVTSATRYTVRKSKKFKLPADVIVSRVYENYRRWTKTKTVIVPISSVKYGKQRIEYKSGSILDIFRKILLENQRKKKMGLAFEEISADIYVRRGYFEVGGKGVECYTGEDE